MGECRGALGGAAAPGQPRRADLVAGDAQREDVEAAIGLAILVSSFRNRGSIEVEDVTLMKG